MLRLVDEHNLRRFLILRCCWTMVIHSILNHSVAIKNFFTSSPVNRYIFCHESSSEVASPIKLSPKTSLILPTNYLN